MQVEVEEHPPLPRGHGSLLHRVEYFGVKLEGFAFTEAGWVQSYGSRYVRPPIIYGDVTRTGPITVKEFKFAQSLTKKPVKGMLTGAPAHACALNLAYLVGACHAVVQALPAHAN